MPLSWIRIAVAAGVTIAALVIALSYWTYIHYSDNPNMLSGVGQLIGSTATTITFVSLVISQSIQVHQLLEQKNAIRLQADSLDLQTRTAVEAASVSAAQIYLQVSGDARRTLGYHARSLL